jgi:hypothetical protein
LSTSHIDNKNPSAKLNDMSPDGWVKMPVGYRLFFWLMIIDIVLLTGFVWLNVIQTIIGLKAGVAFPSPDFSSALMTYHAFLFILSLVAYYMQVTWRTLGSMSAYPTVFAISVLLLHVLAAQVGLLAG